MKIVFFTFYYPPDLSAGSFRAAALVKALSTKLANGDELHIITSHPNRYKNHRVEAKDIEVEGQITIHRIPVPYHNNGMFLQIFTFAKYALSAFRLCRRLKPKFLIGTTSRLMTGILTGITAFKLNCQYFIDLRDIFSVQLPHIFSGKSKILGHISRSVFFLIEKKLFQNAAGVNVVSEGFLDYFQKRGLDVSSWSFFSNGVDKEFISISNIKKDKPNKVKTVFYAGNIGFGQGLDHILPKVAKVINNYRFLVVGAGGAESKLTYIIKKENIDNIQIIPPVKRCDLIKYYQEADILFLHLNDGSAYKRVLPSKIFEYAALNKPILAGLSGYSADFMAENVPNSIVFAPGDVDGCIDAIKKIKKRNIKDKSTEIFVKKFSREKIMARMANKILSIV